MRITSLKAFITVTLLAAFVAAPAAFGQTLIDIRTNSWRYYQQGDQPTNPGQPGINWRMPNFDDSGPNWGSGTGVHGVEGATIPYPVQTQLTLQSSVGAGQVIAYYFRTHFNYTGQTNPLFLSFTNQFDDAAVVYLNGNEIYRYRMPAGAPGPNTQGVGGAIGDAGLELITLTNSPYMRQGDNVLAVEVHQTGATSSDIVMGVGLGAIIPVPIVITEHPQSQTAAVGDEVTFSVTVTGSDPVYRWFRNNTPIFNATNSSYTLLSAQFSQAGTYHVTVSNILGGVRSSNAVLTVVADVEPPVLVGAVLGEGETNRILAEFTEDIARVIAIREGTCPGPTCTTNYSMSGTNPANYSLRDLATGEEIEITGATVGLGLQVVRLNLATNVDCSREYVLKVSNVADVRTNIIRPNSEAFLGCMYRTNLVDFQANWVYNGSLEFEGLRVATNWYTTNFVNDGTWGENVAPFYFSQDTETTCFGQIGGGQPIGTSISDGYPTYVFRHTFVVPTNFPTAGQLRLAHVIDDSAIFYLNGNELLRYQLPPGEINHDFRAPTCIEATCATNSYALSNLLPGTNVLAVEVHNCNEFTGSDMMFGLQLDIIVTNRITSVPTISEIVQRAGNQRRTILQWGVRGWRLQTTTNVGNPTSWVNVSGITTNAMAYTNTYALPGDRQRFYRLCRP